MAALIGIVTKAEATKAVINSLVDKIGDPSDLWNSLCSGQDEQSLLKMIRQCGGEGIKDAAILIGKEIKCHGASGFGTYSAYVQKVDVGKGWL